MRHQDWPFHQFFGAGFGPRVWAHRGPEGADRRHRRRRHQMFEAGEIKFVLARRIGQVEYGIKVGMSLIEDALTHQA